MPNISGVQIRHGPQEDGKDIVFHGPGPFGDSLPCACVVKNQRITGAVASSGGARTVLFQVQQALDTPFTDGSGRDVRIQRAYVVCPFPISAAALNSIAGALRERSGAVIFVGGHDLFRLFKSHWPTFLADEYSMLARYADDVRKQLVANRPLNNLTIQYGLGSAEQPFIYVRQSFNRRLTSYSCDSLTELLPQRAELKGALSEGHVNDLVNRFERILGITSHLTEWNLFGDSSPRLPVDLDTLREMLWKDWTEGPFVKRSKLQPPRRRLRNPHRVESLVRRIRDILDDYDSAVNASLKRMQGIVLGGSRIPDSVNDPEFQQAAWFDECCRSAPDGAFSAGTERLLVWPSNLLDAAKGPFICVGAPGSGKTSFCRWSALTDLERANAEEASIVPVYVALRDAPLDPSDTYRSSFLLFASASALAGNTPTDKLSGNKNFRFYLDGLDEVVDTAKQRRVIELAREAVREGHEVIITARDYVKGPWLRPFPRVWLSGLDAAQVKELASGWLGHEGAVRFEQQLENIPRTSDVVLSTPVGDAHDPGLQADPTHPRKSRSPVQHFHGPSGRRMGSGQGRGTSVSLWKRRQESSADKACRSPADQGAQGVRKDPASRSDHRHPWTLVEARHSCDRN